MKAICKVCKSEMNNVIAYLREEQINKYFVDEKGVYHPLELEDVLETEELSFECIVCGANDVEVYFDE